MKGLRNLCTPSYVYLVISAIALVVMMYQNMGNVDKYCLGSYTCNVSSTALIFVIKAIYILFWTWILNMMCRAGSSGVAWFLLLLPVILMFVILAGMMLSNNIKEGLHNPFPLPFPKGENVGDDKTEGMKVPPNFGKFIKHDDKTERIKVPPNFGKFINH